MERMTLVGAERLNYVSSIMLSLLLSLAIAASAKAQGLDAAQTEPVAPEVTSAPAEEVSGSPDAGTPAAASDPAAPIDNQTVATEGSGPAQPSPPAQEQTSTGSEELATIPVDGTADAEPAGRADSMSKNRFVEEIVVTAQKREENVQDVPISVTAFSGDLLAAQGIDDPSKLANVTPGLTYTSLSSFAIIYIRGVGSDAFLAADPSVASYIDGIYYPYTSGLAQSFGRVERIEVLKGPQGTLFGRNSTGGAISITTETPNREFNGFVETGYSSFNTSKTSALLSGPLGEHFAGSLAVFYNNTGQYYDYSPDSVQQDLPNEITKGVRAKLRWMPTDELEATIGYTRIEQDGINTALNPNTAPSEVASLLGADRQPRDHTARVDGDVYFFLDTEVFTADAKWSPGGIDVKLLGGVQRHRNLGQNDFDGSNAPIITFSAPLAADVQTAELQLLSNSESWASDWLESIAGLYYFHSDIGLDPILGLFGGAAGDIQLFQSLPTLGVQTLIQGLPAGLRNVIGPLPLTGGVSIALSGFVETQSGAAFAQSTAHLTDWLALTLGARYQLEKREATQSTFGLYGADGSTTPVFDFVNDPLFANQTDLSKKTSFLSPKVSLSVTPVDDVLIYASWQKANKSGTYNAINIYDAIDYAKPEEIKAVELGLKSEFLGGLARFNAAVFHAKIDNLQVQFVSLFNGGAVSIENAASARTRGVEFDTLLLLFPNAVEGLVFTASGAYVDATYTSYPNASGFNETTGFYNFGTGDYSGNPSVRTPKWSGTAALSKTTSFDKFTVETAVDAYYSDRFSYLAQNSLFFQDSFYLINARVSALYDPWNVRVTLFGDNLNDAVHDVGQFPNDFGRLNVLAPPRSYGMRLTWTFD